MKVGVPNSFCYAGMENFFIRVIPEVLEDSQIVFSGKTTKEMVEYGLKNGCDELCIPAKIFIGHVEYLIRKKECRCVVFAAPCICITRHLFMPQDYWYSRYHKN